MRLLRPSVVLLAGLALGLSATMPAGALTKAQLKSKTLAITDMPTGWSVDNEALAQSGATGCLSGLKHLSRHEIRSLAAFHQGNAPELEENLTAGPGSAAAYAKVVKTLNACTSYHDTQGGHTVTVYVGALSFPTVGQSSRAYSLSFSAEGITFSGDVVLFRTGQVSGVVLFEDFGSPDIGAVERWVNKAVTKASS